MAIICNGCCRCIRNMRGGDFFSVYDTNSKAYRDKKPKRGSNCSWNWGCADCTLRYWSKCNNVEEKSEYLRLCDNLWTKIKGIFELRASGGIPTVGIEWATIINGFILGLESQAWLKARGDIEKAIRRVWCDSDKWCEEKICFLKDHSGDYFRWSCQCKYTPSFQLSKKLLMVHLGDHLVFYYSQGWSQKWFHSLLVGNLMTSYVQYVLWQRHDVSLRIEILPQL